LYNTEIYLDKCPDDHIDDRRVQYGKVIWARVHGFERDFTIELK